MPEDLEAIAEDLDFNDPRVFEMNEEMYEIYRIMREKHGGLAPAPRYGGYWWSIGYDETVKIAQDWETFSSAVQLTVPKRESQPLIPPLGSDPPVHTRYRRALNPYLSPGSVAKREEIVRDKAISLIDEFVELGKCDLSEDFAIPFPGEIFLGELMHLPAEDIKQCREWLEMFNYRAIENPERAMEGQLKLFAYVTEFVARRRQAPRVDDLVDALFFTEVDGQLFNDIEVASSIMLLIAGGFETTTHAIVNAAVMLSEQPELKTQLLDNPALLPTAIEELLRVSGGLHAMTRVATRDHEIGGRCVRAGDPILLNFAAANRDPAQFPDPDRCVLDRSPNRHIAFGFGVHRCVGSNLARLEIRVAFEELLRRIPDFRVDPEKTPRYHGEVARGYTSVPVVFTPGARSTD